MQYRKDMNYKLPSDSYYGDMLFLKAIINTLLDEVGLRNLEGKRDVETLLVIAEHLSNVCSCRFSWRNKSNKNKV